MLWGFFLPSITSCPFHSLSLWFLTVPVPPNCTLSYLFPVSVLDFNICLCFTLYFSLFFFMPLVSVTEYVLLSKSKPERYWKYSLFIMGLNYCFVWIFESLLKLSSKSHKQTTASLSLNLQCHRCLYSHHLKYFMTFIHSKIYSSSTLY